MSALARTPRVRRKTNGPVRVNHYDNLWYRVALVKVVWALWRFVLPLYVWGTPLGTFAALFAVSELVSGYWLALNFEVSHVADTVSWLNADESARVFKDCWAAAQVKTSVDYSHDNGVATYLCGALNYQVWRVMEWGGGVGVVGGRAPAPGHPRAVIAIPPCAYTRTVYAPHTATTQRPPPHPPPRVPSSLQIEHHLFPGVSQYHYPALAPIVIATCKEFGVSYQCVCPVRLCAGSV